MRTARARSSALRSLSRVDLVVSVRRWRGPADADVTAAGRASARATASATAHSSSNGLRLGEPLRRTCKGKNFSSAGAPWLPIFRRRSIGQHRRSALMGLSTREKAHRTQKDVGQRRSGERFRCGEDGTTGFAETQRKNESVVIEQRCTWLKIRARRTGSRAKLVAKRPSRHRQRRLRLAAPVTLAPALASSASSPAWAWMRSSSRRIGRSAHIQRGCATIGRTLLEALLGNREAVAPEQLAAVIRRLVCAAGPVCARAVVELRRSDRRNR